VISHLLLHLIPFYESFFKSSHLTQNISYKLSLKRKTRWFIRGWFSQTEFNLLNSRRCSETTQRND